MSPNLPIRSRMGRESFLARSEFMESGVAPYVSKQETCSICCNELTSAIRINQCGHCFDMDCLAAWFTSRMKPNTCPMCREKLFQKEDELAGILRIFDSPGFAWDDFGIPGALKADIPHIQPVGSNLIPAVISVPEEAMAHIDCRLASSAFALAGNIAIAVAQVQGSPLDKDEMIAYRHIVKAMYDFIESRDGEEMQVRFLPTDIIAGASEGLDDAGIEIDIDVLWPDDIFDLEDDPARRAVHLAFFVTWILYHNLEAAK